MSNPYQSPEQPLGLVSRATKVRWLVFALSCGVSWFLYLHRYTWLVVRPQLEQEYGFTNVELETINAVFYIGYTVGQVPSGIVCDLFGPHVFLVVIIVLWSLMLPLHGAFSNVFGLGTVRVLFGAAQAGGYPALGNVTQRWFPVATRTRMQGFIASAFGRGGGAMSTVIMASLLMGVCGLSWQVALIVMAAAGVAFAAIFYALFRNSPRVDPRVNDAERELIQAGSPPDTGKGSVLPFGKAFRNRSMQVMILQQFMNAGSDVVYTSITGSYFLAKGLSITQVGMLASMPLWGGALGGIVGGYLNDYLIQITGSRRGRIFVGLTGKLIAAAALLVAIAQTSALAAAIGLFVVKFFSDWSQPTVWGTCTDLGGRNSATVFSINNTAGNAGALSVPFVVGMLLDYYTTVQTVDGVVVRETNYTPMFILVAVMYVGCSLLWLLIDPSKPIASEEEVGGEEGAEGSVGGSE